MSIELFTFWRMNRYEKWLLNKIGLIDHYQSMCFSVIRGVCQFILETHGLSAFTVQLETVCCRLYVDISVTGGYINTTLWYTKKNVTFLHWNKYKKVLNQNSFFRVYDE